MENLDEKISSLSFRKHKDTLKIINRSETPFPVLFIIVELAKLWEKVLKFMPYTFVWRREWEPLESYSFVKEHTIYPKRNKKQPNEGTSKEEKRPTEKCIHRYVVNITKLLLCFVILTETFVSSLSLSSSLLIPLSFQLLQLSCRFSLHRFFMHPILSKQIETICDEHFARVLNKWWHQQWQ